ncbi:hypothetical protein KKG22_03750 [Patescibacteria group bacterium]|nr:hypothetical protein [Patescibacteria group bacterium]MBU1721261.1 hypothetical protein [Patescibacteria group bacterium]MBU1901031.1 hypothetical protein [Patescibacteria group bacterium]
MAENQEFKISTTEKERSYEVKETEKSGELDPEARAAAMRERAEYLVKEVQTGTKQMQSILIHIAQVRQVIRKIRQQLQLVDGDDDTASVQDQARADALKKQIATHKKELILMRGELVAAHAQELAKMHGGVMTKEIQAEAEKKVEALLESI